MLLTTKLKNQLRKLNSGYACRLSNVNVNGQKRGCSGFVSNPANGLVVYVNTEHTSASWLKDCLVRFAENERDYSGRGGANVFVDEAEVARMIHEMLSCSAMARAVNRNLKGARG